MSSSAATPATESGIPLEELARRLTAAAGDGAGGSANAREASGDLRVPWSGRAALVAGVSAACLSAAMTAIAGPPALELAPGVPIPAQGPMEMLGPALMGWSLFSGGESAASVLIVAHGGLRLLNIRSPLAYAIAGGLASAAATYANHALGGEPESLGASAAIGAMAGFLYRIVAGARPVSRRG